MKPSFPYKRHRFAPEIISRCVWLYFRFPVSYRDIEELMAARGITLTYETVRQWCQKFGQAYASQLPQHHARPGHKWHLDASLQPSSLFILTFDQDGTYSVQNSTEKNCNSAS